MTRRTCTSVHLFAAQLDGSQDRYGGHRPWRTVRMLALQVDATLESGPMMDRQGSWKDFLRGPLKDEAQKRWPAQRESTLLGASRRPRGSGVREGSVLNP